jgi:hypothetical protein
VLGILAGWVKKNLLYSPMCRDPWRRREASPVSKQVTANGQW